MSDDVYLVPAEEIAEMEGLAKTHFLNPDAKRVNKSLGDLAGLTGLGFHIIDVAPGHATTEHHVHYHEDECVYVLEGEATAHIGDTALPIKAGDFIGYRKGGLAHSIVNTGDVLLRCIVVGERRDHDVGDYPKLGKRIYRQVGLPWNVVDHADIVTPTGTGKK
ncbi:cupin domain-containing protein [Maritimibacter sp. UBA3975]|uniref:cupin domain-containing protein n=1 Tax=Maritimibacter sp. UBA3975 TaxID=1946833 RepID=UPI000C09510B|nr:cupin domain-containing protein [Maritimibacter sp. UBA3975]MAM60536.1 cupin [Maritimibacter sp.]|tara:strand:+ start:23067 stop:23555 length:489 start_codon:yes stop_codon:yes gene_type:complete